MPNVRPPTIALFAVSFISIVFVLHAGAQRNNAIDTYAITNARIVTVSGPTIDRGTIVIRNGLIIPTRTSGCPKHLLHPPLAVGVGVSSPRNHGRVPVVQTRRNRQACNRK